MRRVIIMLAAVASAFAVASVIPDSPAASFTSGQAVTLDDIVDTSYNRVPEYCVSVVRRNTASLPEAVRRDPYQLMNAEHFALHSCMDRIARGETPS